MVKIKKLRAQHVNAGYIRTINSNLTKKHIEFAKKGPAKKSKHDLVNYIKNLPKNEYLYGVFIRDTHVANFKFSKLKNKLFIGFLVFIKFQGKGIIKKNFPKILKLTKKNFYKYKKLYLGVDTNNYRAISLYKKLGFKYVSNSKRTMSLKLNHKSR